MPTYTTSVEQRLVLSLKHQLHAGASISVGNGGGQVTNPVILHELGNVIDLQKYGICLFLSTD